MSLPAGAWAADDIAALQARAQAGDAGAQYSFGLAYDKGKGVQQDYAEAVRWFRKAAEQGDTKARKALKLLGDE